jgi:hypothetical protein
LNGHFDSFAMFESLSGLVRPAHAGFGLVRLDRT